MKKYYKNCLILVGALMTSQAAIAAPNGLLGVQPGHPDIFFSGSAGQGCSYDGTTMTITSNPSTLTMVAGDFPTFFDNGLVTITADIDGNGTFSGGSLTVAGTVGAFGNPVLTGIITNYGIADLGQDDRMEFTFSTTGGSLGTDFGGDGSIIVFMEDSTYTGSFVPGVTCTIAKGNIGPEPLPPSGAGDGTGTIGYWKNHPEAWPTNTVTIGNQTFTKNEAIAILKAAVKGDKTLSMSKQLIAAKLNVIDGNDSSCIDATIDAADQWMIAHGGVGSGQRQWDNGDLLHDDLDSYNNGLLCAPHRD